MTLMTWNFKRISQYSAAGGVLAFLGVFLILPVLVVVGKGLDLRVLREALGNPVYAEGIINAMLIAVVTTSLVFLIALPLAVVFDRYEFPGKKFCAFAVLLPMILPPFIGALGFQQILGHYGVVNMLLAKLGFGPADFLGGDAKFVSICLIEALHLYPILYLNLSSALNNLDPEYEAAAANLGVGKARRFLFITLPSLKSGLFAGTSLVLIWSFTELGTPLMFGYYRTLPVQIFNGLTELSTTGTPFALVVVMLFISTILYCVGKLVLGRDNAAFSAKGSRSGAAATPRGWKKFLPAALFAAVSFLAATPHLALIFTAFFRDWYRRALPAGFTLEHFESALSHSIVVPSILNSLRYSLIAMAAALLIGTLIAMASSRWKLKGGSLLDVLSMLPLAVPGIVVAFGYLGMSLEFAWAEKIFDPENNPLFLLAAAYAVRRLPYVVRSVGAGLEQAPEELEKAARNLGAGAWRTFGKITLPLISSGVVAGGLFAFSFSMLEVSDSLILAQKAEFYPITKAIFELSQILGPGPFIGCAFGVWTMFFLAAAFAAATWFLGKKVGSIFRL